MIKFEVKHTPDIAIVEFELERNLEPADLPNITPPDPVKENFSSKIVVLSGRGPVWLYAYLTHYYHPVKALGVFDPRLNGAVIVESHTNEVKVGQVVQFDQNAPALSP